MLVVIGLFRSCSMHLYIVCILTLNAFAFIVFAFYISLTLMIFVFVAFAYCFHVNDVRSFRVTISIEIGKCWLHQRHGSSSPTKRDCLLIGENYNMTGDPEESNVLSI